MKLFKFVFLTFCVIFTLGSSVSAGIWDNTTELKIRKIDPDKIISAYLADKKSELEVYQKEVEEDLKNKLETLNKEIKEIKDELRLFDPDSLVWEEKVKVLERKYFEAEQEITDAERKISQKIDDGITAIITKVAERRGVDIVLNVKTGTIIYVKPELEEKFLKALDFSDEILSEVK